MEVRTLYLNIGIITQEQMTNHKTAKHEEFIIIITLKLQSEYIILPKFEVQTSEARNIRYISFKEIVINLWYATIYQDVFQKYHI